MGRLIFWGSSIFVAVTLAGFGAAAAKPNTAYAAKVRDCSALTSKADRYDCYDRLDSERPIARASSDPAARHSEVPFGHESMAALPRSREAEAAPSQLVAHAVSATSAGPGYWTIALDDGGRWRMLELVHQFVPPRPGQAVRIRRVALGSFLLFVGQQPGVRVQRLS